MPGQIESFAVESSSTVSPFSRGRHSRFSSLKSLGSRRGCTCALAVLVASVVAAVVVYTMLGIRRSSPSTTPSTRPSTRTTSAIRGSLAFNILATSALTEEQISTVTKKALAREFDVDETQVEVKEIVETRRLVLKDLRDTRRLAGMMTVTFIIRVVPGKVAEAESKAKAIEADQSTLKVAMKKQLLALGVSETDASIEISSFEASAEASTTPEAFTTTREASAEASTTPEASTDAFTTTREASAEATTKTTIAAREVSISYHGYETMPFYLADLNVAYLAPDCSSSDGKIYSKASPENGFAGPFSFDDAQQTSQGMNACADDGTSLGALNMHKDPCDVIGNPARVGIRNMGNSCFLNSAMQVLLGIPGICAAIFDERYVNDTARSPIPALRSFADSYRVAQGAVSREDARRFRQDLLNLNIVHSISGQEDSSEALTKLLGLYNFPNSSAYISTRMSYLAFDRKDLVPDSSGKDDFLDASCSADEPEKCRTKGIVEPTPSVQLKLPFMPQHSVTLDELYAESFQREAMTSEVRVQVPPDPHQALRKYEKVTELMPIASQLLLDVQLTAYDLNQDRVRKRDDKVVVPAVWRGMTLVGISQHLGDDNNGHYVAYKKRCTNEAQPHAKEWVKYDDDRTSLENTRTALTAAAEGKLLYFASDPQLPSCDSLIS